MVTREDRVVDKYINSLTSKLRKKTMENVFLWAIITEITVYYFFNKPHSFLNVGLYETVEIALHGNGKTARKHQHYKPYVVIMLVICQYTNILVNM